MRAFRPLSFALLACAIGLIPATGQCWSIQDVFGPSTKDIGLTCKLVAPKQESDPKKVAFMRAMNIRNPRRIAVQVHNRTEYFLSQLDVKFSLFDPQGNRLAHDWPANLLWDSQEPKNQGEIGPGNTVTRYVNLHSFESATRVECRLEAVHGKK